MDSAFGYIQYFNDEQAEQAIRNTNGKNFHNRLL
jgi:hypothetical protein